ncbi:MAG: DUF4982 domain-containing protein [Clostridia bacterium]|nr:DUF4982 domain-containing protein [Clostridia bacterium]
MSERRLNFDCGWKFTKNIPPLTDRYRGGHPSYVTTRCGERCPFSKSEYNDSRWMSVDLPHDWIVGEPYDETALASHGYQKAGYAWYRKVFEIDVSLRGKQFTLVFGGISGNSEIYINGSLIRRNFSAFNEIVIDITDRVYFDKPNTVAVFVDRRDIEIWAHEGSGIYRHVWFFIKDKLNVAHDGIYVNPDKVDGEWAVPVEVTVENSFYEDKNASIIVEISDQEGEKVALMSAECLAAARSKAVVTLETKISHPSLWELDSPVLYTAKVRVEGEFTSDCEMVDFGFRTFSLDSDNGFVINGKKTVVNAVCVHQNFAGVGVALTDSVIDYRMRIIKTLGVNGVRCSHYNMAREFYDWCDRNGIIVIDENRNFESDDYHLQLFREQTIKNRNHPSLMFLMMFNEEPIAKNGNGVNIFNNLKFEFRKYNRRAIITGAMCDRQHLSAEGVAPLLDVTGINYQLDTYDEFEKLFPNQPFIGSENVAENASRGFFRNEDYRLSDLDENYQVGVFNNVRESFRALSAHSRSIGLMPWSAFDYRGETIPFPWPSVTSYFGFCDICGYPKGIAEFLRVYTAEGPFLKIVQNMNHRSYEWIRCATVSNCDEVELVLNGKTLGRRANDIYEQNYWEFTFEAGRLEAFGYKNGKKVASDVMETTGKPEKIVLELPENCDEYKGDIIPVKVYSVDSEGRRVPDASNRIDFFCENGKIVACSNGDQICHESELVPSRNLHMGYALVLVKADGNGNARLSAKAESLSDATIEF